jgi:hypothetical protein
VSTAYPAPGDSQPNTQHTTPSQPGAPASETKESGCIKWGFIGGVVIILTLFTSCGSSSDTDTKTTGVMGTSVTTTAEKKTTIETQDEYTTAVGLTTEETTSAAPTPAEQRHVDAMPWLESQFGMPPSQAVVMDPTVWYGYVSNAYVDKAYGNLHVQMQVDRKSDKELGEQAAKALVNFVGFSDDPVVSGVEWVIAEDGTETVIKQEKVSR